MLRIQKEMKAIYTTQTIKKEVKPANLAFSYIMKISITTSVINK